MEQDAVGDNNAILKTLNDSDERPRSAVNSVILDYYKKFGRKRDLEQYFSLSTAQSEIRDPRSLFWRRMKEQSDTSDSAEKKSESSNEICRISIRCSIPDTSEAQKRDPTSNNDSDSPPIITDVLLEPSPSCDESIDDNHSQKSAEATLDTSMNKAISPTSSITSQRKLEWDSLADVGYANESDRKTSASSLSTLEREVLAQKQQFSLDYKQNSDLGIPTAHSTPVDPNDSKPKGKKGQGKKTISISRKDVDFVEVNVPEGVENIQPINVNLTKQFSVNLQKDGGMTIDNIKKDISVSPEKHVDEAESIAIKFDKQIQTSLLRSKEKDRSPIYCLNKAKTSAQKTPILISLNTLRWRQRRKKHGKSRTKLKSKKKHITRKEIITEKDKSGEQVSEAESFEYMPGHVYNQNQLKRQDSNKSNSNNNIVGNKSSLESSAVQTTDSSKESKYSFNKDLDKSISVLKSALKEKYDSNLKKKLIKEIIQRLLKSNYGEGENTPDFLSVLSLTSNKTPTTSTSEADTEGKVIHVKPKKSILRMNKFDSTNVASTSQSAPNIPSVVNSNKPLMSYLTKITPSTTTETDLSNNSAKDVTSSDTVLDKTSSQELYKKYINALKKEEAYKQHLREKELFLKQKLVRSEPKNKVPLHNDPTKNTKLKELIKDLTRNNYDDGSGDASKLEGGSSSNFDILKQRVPKKHRSHSVFTLSSGNSHKQNRNCNSNSRSQNKNAISPRAGNSKNLTDSCNKPAVTDSSVQVNIDPQEKQWSCKPPNLREEEKYVCVGSERTPICPHHPADANVYHYSKPNPSTLSKGSCVANQPICAMHPASSRPKKEEPIECTRCLQTKISIHPKISDPSVSDLNIISSSECVKLIHQLYKKVSQTNSGCQCSNEKDDCNSCTCKSSKDNMPLSDEQDNLLDDVSNMAPLTHQQTTEKNTTQCCIESNKAFLNQPEDISDNIMIPIHGTNMMLKLSIGGKPLNVPDKQTSKDGHMPCRTNTLDRVNHTDKLKTILKGPSTNNCSKSVQAESSSGVFGEASTSCGLKRNKEQDLLTYENLFRDYATEKEVLPRTSKIDHGILLDSANASGFNTYPKKVQISERRPLFRSNTDTGNLGATSGIQTDNIYSENKETVPCFHADIQQTMPNKKQAKSMGDCRAQPRSSKESSTDHSLSGRTKSSTDEKYKSLKNKFSSDSQRPKAKKGYEAINVDENPNDLILDVIKDITKRYSKEDTNKRSKKKCYKEIMNALSYLLDTDDSGDGDQEFTKKIQISERKRSTEPSSESELVSNDYLSEAEKQKFASGQKCDSTPKLTNEASPQKNSMKIIESKIKSDSSGHKTVKSDIAIDKKHLAFDTGKIPDLKKGHEITCVCGCGFSDCKECMTPLSTEYETGKESCKLEGLDKERSEKNRTSEKESMKLTEQSTRYEPSNKVKTCDMGCGCEGTSECKDCVSPRSPECGTNGNISESSRGQSNKQKGKCKLPKKEPTCDKSCGCDSSEECNDCGDQHSSDHRTGSYDHKCTEVHQQKTMCDSSKETKATCDKGCGCDGSMECIECGEPSSLKHSTSTYAKEFMKPKKEETYCTSPKKNKSNSDKSQGCDETSESNDCGDRPSLRHKTRTCGKETVKPKKQESRCTSPINTKNTCDKGCGCDGSSECQDCVEPHCPKYRAGKSDTESSRRKDRDVRCHSPKKTKTTCDKSCGCDGSTDCKDCVGPQTPKYGISKCGKESVKHNKTGSPKKPKTCDRGCGCDESSECSECVESHSSKYGSEKLNQESRKTKKQDKCNSPKKPKTCDRACGCDGSSECSQCVEPHSPRYRTNKCGKGSIRSNNQSRSNSPNKIKSTCDKTCGCDGAFECKECNHKTGRCAKETSRCKRQEAKRFVNKCVQSTVKRVKSLYSHCDDSSDLPLSTDPPCCATDSPTSKLVHKIKKECEKYQKRKFCKKCETSSSTTVSCDHCRRVKQCHCRHHKCRCHRSRSTEKLKKKCLAYNLILQTSDSLVSEEAVFDQCRKLQNVIIRVPKCKQANIPFKEACAKIEQKMPYCDTRFEPKGRSQSWPNECGISSTDDVKIAKACTVRDYLEKNRPDFVDRCTTRQNCIRMISENRAKEQSELREQLVGLESLPSLNNEELIYLAQQLGSRRNRPLQQKIIGEREMKKHSEKIYKSLPEVIRKKEDAKKESIKKTNLLMANIFKKNLQKKTLRGDVNISNYSQVVKI